MEHLKFRDRPLYVQISSIIFVIVFFALCVIGANLYIKNTSKEKAEYEKVKQKSKHIQIDDINEQPVYMIIYNSDTLGVVCTEKK